MFGKALCFGLSYYLSVQLGMLFVADSVAFFWPASGVACGFFIFSNKKLWPLFAVVFIPAYIYPLLKHGGYPPIVIGFLCLANLVQSLVAGFLVQRIKPDIDINRLKSSFHFMVLSALVAPSVAAVIGVPTFYFFFGYLSFFDYLLFWVVGNCAGILPVIIFMSVLVKLKKRDFFLNVMTHYSERILYAIAYGTFIYWMLAAGSDETLGNKIIPYFTFPCILYSSIRYGAKYTGVLTIIFACLSAYFSAMGNGPYISPTLPTVYNAISFDIFIIILTSTGLLLAALQFELTQAQQQLKDEKNEALELSRLKSQFIANVNHEIRTPVTGIVGAADLLSGSSLNPDQARLVSVVRDSCGYLLALISNVLEFSRLENKKIDLKKEPINLEELVHGSVKSFIHLANEKGLVIYVDCQTENVLIESDSTAMQQMVGNLLANAIKFTESGYILVSIVDDGDLKLSVKDTGIGIALDKVDTVFECFSQEDTSMNRKFGGAGLGLAIVEKIIHLIPGWVTVDTGAGVGSTFTLNLQIQRKAQNAQSLISRHAVIDLYTNDTILSGIVCRYFESRVDRVNIRPWRVEDAPPIVADETSRIAVICWEGLDSQKLVEYCRKLTEGRYIFILPWFMDKPVNPVVNFIYAPLYTQELMTLIAGDVACKVSVVNGGEPDQSALRQLKVLLADDNQVNSMIIQSILSKKGCQVLLAENGSEAVEKAKSNQFDLIFMDIQMPIMDGFTATREIRKFLSTTPIVALTANSNDQLVAEFEASGMNGVLPKPINHQMLDEILRQVQGKH